MSLAALIKTSWKEMRIKIANTHKQAGSDDRCTALVNGQDPSLFVNHQDSMRPHLVR